MKEEQEKKMDFNHNDYEILSRDILYDGRFRLARYKLRYRLFNGGWSKEIFREVLERSSAVAVLPYDPYLDQVVLIEQFRPGALAHPGSPWMLEIVAGIIDTNEKTDEIAIREAKEEADCVIESLYPLPSFFPSPGGSNEFLTLFAGKTDSSAIGGIFGLVAEAENIRAFAVPVEEAYEKVRAGFIQTAPAIVALQWLQLNKHLLQALWLEALEPKT
jgi:ADP-ribose pyrophosphatase